MILVTGSKRSLPTIGSSMSVEQTLLASTQASQISAEEALKKEHAGHEEMHSKMALIFLVSLFVTQAILYQWRIRHARSYFVVTLILMWLVPFVFSLMFMYIRMLTVWFLYTAAITYLCVLVRAKPLKLGTPRVVYKFFYYAHSVSEILVFSSLIIFLIGLFCTYEPASLKIVSVSLLIVFFGFYFGVLTRDIAYVLTERINDRLGMISDNDIPRRTVACNICALCGLIMTKGLEPPELDLSLNCLPGVDFSHLSHGEKIITLDCNHDFHDFCIRGWILVGKRETCPCCKERVNLRKAFAHPWEKANFYYGDLLHGIRYMVAWHPILIGTLYVVNKLLGLK